MRRREFITLLGGAAAGLRRAGKPAFVSMGSAAVRHSAGSNRPPKSARARR
jgi:hypothetical protein